MENIGVHYVKAAEVHNKSVLAFEIVQIIEAEANFYVSNYNNKNVFKLYKLTLTII